jgi:hypothetical protein
VCVCVYVCVCVGGGYDWWVVACELGMKVESFNCVHVGSSFVVM